MLAIHLPLNSMLISLMCFVLSCLFYLPAAVSVSTLAVMSPVTGHAAPVTINCCLTSTHSIPLSLLMLCCCLPVLCCYYFVCSQQYRKSYRFGNQLKAQDWPNNLGYEIPAFNWLKQKNKVLRLFNMKTSFNLIELICINDLKILC